MNGSPHLQRALLLAEQGRHALAEQELRAHLLDRPTDPMGHALLAMTLSEMERFDEAEASAGVAIGHDPGMAFAHHAMAVVLADRRRSDEAEAAIREAIRLDPMDPDSWALLAGLAVDRRAWDVALHAAEQGLMLDAEHVSANNLRAMALVSLGKKEDAGATLDRTLARDPDNSMTHANKGWTLLEAGRRDEAIGHFRESLRLDPTNEWARSGLVEAIKAGNPLYALMLKYFLWTEKISERAGWGIVLGAYFGYRFLYRFGRANPEWMPFITPLLVLYVAFALLTWLARPLFNLALFLHPVGRHALADDQRAQARLVGATLGIALLAAAVGLVAPGATDFFLVAIVAGLLSLPLSAVHNCRVGWPRRTMGLVVSGLALLGATASVIVGILRPPEESAWEALGVGTLVLYFLGILVSQFLANWLVRQIPKR